jgi:hypothetical protein
VTTMCCIVLVISIVTICINRRSCLSRNVSLITRLRLGGGDLVSDGGMYLATVHIDRPHSV